MAIQEINEAIAETTTLLQSEPTDVRGATPDTQSQATPADTVTISAAAANLAQQPTSSQVRVLYSQGESVQTIAQQLGIAPPIVRNYLGIAAQAATA